MVENARERLLREANHATESTHSSPARIFCVVG
jgi:hypothetical protein